MTDFRFAILQSMDESNRKSAIANAMKILDRYVLFSFLRNYLIATMVLVGMFVVLDMVFRFDELVELRQQTGGSGTSSTFEVITAITDYYFHQSFLIFIYVSGIIPVVAAAFTLIRMTRFNELSAILAAGVPLIRMAAPILIAGVVLQVLLILDQELLIPSIIPQLTRQHDKLISGEQRSFRIEMMQDEDGNLLTASRYTPAGTDGVAVMQELDLIERDANLDPVAHVTADRAQWDPLSRQWRLTNGRRVTGLQPHMQRSSEVPVDAYRSNITPDEIALWKSGDFVNLLSTRKINELLQRRASYGAVALQQVKHSRVTQSLMNIVLLALAIPCVLVRQPQELRGAIFKCLIIVGVAMAGMFLCYQIAGRPPSGPQWVDRWPAIWAWMPIFLFTPLAIVLLDRLTNKAS
jgi:lipopolysaccharide export system permease protein